MVVFLRNEFCKIMDKGMGHLKSFWNIIEVCLAYDVKAKMPLCLDGMHEHVLQNKFL